MSVKPTGPGRLSLGWLVCLLVVITLDNVSPAQAATKKDKPDDWQESGLTLNLGSNPLCIDPSRPNLAIISENSGAVAYDWTSGQRNPLNNQPFELCGPTGWLYAHNTGGQAVRYSASDPAPRQIEHFPTAFAQDGTEQLYALDGGRLWYSPDAGQSWQGRNLPPGDPTLSLAVAASDTQVLYATTGTFNTTTQKLTYAVYFSGDGGQTWEKRVDKRKADGANGTPTLRLETFPVRNTPLDYIELYVDNGATGLSHSQTLYISGDGGRKFSEAGKNSSVFERTQVFYTTGGLIRLRSTESQKYSLSFSVDGGQSWQSRSLPFSFKPANNTGPAVSLSQVANLPANLFINEPNGLWYSADGGQNWQNRGAGRGQVWPTPYAPLTLLGYDPATRKLYRLELPEAAKSSVNGASYSGSPASIYFDPTGHSLAGAFKSYWNGHGGLSQFGYPRTEPFREVNPSDGRVYLVQYFERNRFEYHPENRGTPYEVLLGLLGNQLAANRRSEPPFQPAADGHYTNGTFFAATGHNLRGSFKAYWEAHGGLPIYGYPTSEEFAEVNPDDGQIYLVQYFERNRFEYHPANTGTPYEVLLGLLGNSLLKGKGWL